MLNLDQVRLLENRVEKAVSKIESLTAENNLLRSQLSGLQARVNELEELVRSFKDDQGRIEEGILNALERLSAFEDSVYHTEEATSESDMPADDIETSSVLESSPQDDESADKKTTDTSEQLDIDADWQTEEIEEKKNTVNPDGQIDIF